jgi:hypothetical protein
MLRALAGEALGVASLHGAGEFWFRGYRIGARSLDAPHGHGPIVEVVIEDGAGGATIDRVRTAVAFGAEAGSACAIDALHASATRACRTRSFAGCVSPVDARYASPETGQIS